MERGSGAQGPLLVLDTPSEVRELYAWLRRDPELRSRVGLMERPPPPGALGPVAEAVQVLAHAPELMATVAGVVIAWLRYRTSDVKITIKHPDGTEAQVTISRTKTLGAEQVHALTEQIEAALNGKQSSPAPQERTVD